MAAYAALVSVMQIIHQIQHHPSPPISLPIQQVESLTKIVTFLQEFLEGYSSPFGYSDKADPLEMRIADAAYAAEDVIESHIVYRIFAAEFENHRKKIRFFNCFRGFRKRKHLQKVIEEMDLIKKEVTEIFTEKALVQDQQQRNVSASVSSLRSSFTEKKNAMVGFDGVLLEILDKLTAERLHRQVIPIVGMAGIGKTTFARNVYARPLIKEHFDICAWAIISQQYCTKEILYEVLSQANKESKEELSKMSEEDLGLALYKYLSHRRFLIVMDDMWSIEVWEKIQCFFPDNNNSSRIVVTTRLSKLGSQLNNNYGLEMKFLDEVSSWNLFSNIVFGEKSCPLKLEKIGKTIVEYCRGLPLSIVVMGGLLEKLKHTQECWESVSKTLNSMVNSENDEYCLRLLKMSYCHLPAHLKPCFLYMGVFEEDRTIRVSTLIKLWVSEGLLKPISGKSLEIIAKEYLKDLVDRNLILVHKLGSTGNIKYCKIHDLLRDLCLREAQKERFYQVIGQCRPRGINNQRCIVIPRGTSKMKVVDALESLSHVRSYICDNATVQLLPNLRLLRTLKAYNRDTNGRRKYLLKNVFQLVNLRYLAVGTHKHSKLSPSINLFWNLHTLIIAHPRVVNAPVGIWKMPQLRHIEFHGQGLYLPNPPSSNIVIMENLQTLTVVSNFKCGQEVVQRIPNIKKLGVCYDKVERIESHGDSYCLNNLECLHNLESFLCWDASGRDDYLQKLTFPHSLKKLSLHFSRSFQWEEMLEKIGSLPLLQKLKLTNGWFRTCRWETVEGKFPSLKFLSLEMCCGLIYWTTESSHYPCLEHLHPSGLRELKEIPLEIGEIPTLKSIFLEYCSDSAVECAKKIVEEQEELQGEPPFHVRAVVGKMEGQALQSLAGPNFEVEVSYY